MKDSTKENLEIIDTILNIVISIGAIIGFIVTYKSGFFHKLHNVKTYFHEQINL